ncbi:MAG: hypothetical protein IJZ53_01320 [Tyzzerella sp.]|nr:hypothetical protein [Tyzzerella sp.]
MTYEIYQYVFIGAAVLCGVMAAVTVFLFVYLKIPRVIGDLTGTTAKKAIEEIRKQNASTGDKTYRSSLVNQERGKLTDRISPTGSLYRAETGPIAGAMATEKIGTQQLNETMVLDNVVSEETAVLSNMQGCDFVIEYEITFIHTDEIINLG